MTYINVTKKDTLDSNDSIYILSADGEQEFLDPSAIQPSKWELADSWVYTTNTNLVSFTDLDYNELIIITKNITTLVTYTPPSSPQTKNYANLNFSADNNATSIKTYMVSDTVFNVYNFNTTLDHKIVGSTTIDSNSVLNSISFTPRFNTAVGELTGTINGGQVYVYGKK